MCHLPESICMPPLPAYRNASSCSHHSSFSIHLDRSRLCWPSTNTSRLHATTCIVESLCIVVCMSTKAVHLELCADLTTPEFMAALHRFCNRRGKPADIYSDNGTNFQGANHKLEEVRQQIVKVYFHCNITLCDNHISPIALYATTDPTLWRSVGGRSQKYEDCASKNCKSSSINVSRKLTTILTEVEAVLNSRPLTSVHSTDIDAPPVLTAGHFLIDRPLKALPVREAKDSVNIPVCCRWNLV